MKNLIGIQSIHEKRRLWLLLILFVMVTATVWHAWRNEDSVYKMKPAEFGVTADFADECWDAENKTVTADNLEKTGVLTELEAMQLERGSYQFMVSYNADSENSYVEVCSNMEMDEDGNPGIVYAREQIAADKEGVLLQATIPEDSVGVTLRVYYGGGYLKVNQIEIRSMKRYTDTPILYAVILTSILVTCWVLHREKELAGRAVVILLVLEFMYISAPLWNDFIVIGQDTEIHLGRIRGMYYSLRDGCFPMWINPFQGKGYGNASSIMYPQLFLWIPAILMYLGVSLLNAYKFLLLIMNFAGVVIAYGAFKIVFKDRWTALVAGAFYCTSLYRLGTFYTRGALGEALAMTFLPLFAAGCYQIVIGDERQWILLAAGATGILSSHVLSSYLYAMYGAAFVIVMVGWRFAAGAAEGVEGREAVQRIRCSLFKRTAQLSSRGHFKKRLRSLLKAIVATVLWNLYFLIPFLTFYKESFASAAAQNMGSVMHAHGVYFSQMFAVFVQDGGSSLALGTTKNEMALSMGGMSFLILVVSGLVLYRFKKDSGRVGIVCIWILTVLSLLGASWLFPWGIVEKIPVIGKLTAMQFPWRMFAPATLGCGLLLGYLIRFLRNGEWCRQLFGRNGRTVKVCLLTAAVFLIVLNSLYYMDSLLNMKSVSTKTMADTQGSTDGLYLYEGDSVSVWENGQIVTSDEEGVAVRGYSHRGDRATFSYQTEAGTSMTAATLTVPLYYYPGYHVYVNGCETMIQRTSDGRVSFTAAEPMGDVEIKFEAPISWYVAVIISAVSAVFIIACEMLHSKRRGQLTQME